MPENTLADCRPFAREVARFFQTPMVGLSIGVEAEHLVFFRRGGPRPMPPGSAFPPYPRTEMPRNRDRTE
jgi:hypothetical protein